MSLRPTLALHAALIAAALSLPAFAAIPMPAHWAVAGLPAKPLPPGAKFTLTLNAKIDAGWHLYAMEEPEGGPIATEVGLAEGDALTLTDVQESAPRMVPDPAYKQSLGVFENSAAFTLHLQMPRHALPHDTVAHVQVRYQACNDRVCLPPHTETVSVPLAPLLH